MRLEQATKAKNDEDTMTKLSQSLSAATVELAHPAVVDATHPKAVEDPVVAAKAKNKDEKAARNEAALEAALLAAKRLIPVVATDTADSRIRKTYMKSPSSMEASEIQVIFKICNVRSSEMKAADKKEVAKLLWASMTTAQWETVMKTQLRA
jgi:hypothetical protein